MKANEPTIEIWVKDTKGRRWRAPFRGDVDDVVRLAERFNPAKPDWTIKATYPTQRPRKR